jgi:LDH2 family malate/lactate/ureidoglycolate dehydrogenase
MSETRVHYEPLRLFIVTALERLGLPHADAAVVGDLMAQAELQGSDGHGVIRLLPYARRIRAGGINLKPRIQVVQERPAMALLDGDNGMGHLVTQRAADMAVAKARTCGIGWVGSRLSNHAGPASLYARMPLAHDMIGLYFAVGNANHLPPWGGLDMLLSTNPIAVAVPAGSEPPVVLDMATTVAAYGKVKAKAQRGESMPLGWMIDRLGQPLTDPKRAGEGFLLPIGGYKGYGLALIVGLLAGTLNGAAMGRDVIDFNQDDTSVTNTGQAVMAIDVAAFGDVADFKARVDRLVRDLRSGERMPGVDRIWLPGEQSHERRAANLRDGVALPPALLKQLDAFAVEVGMAPLARTVTTKETT